MKKKFALSILILMLASGTNAQFVQGIAAFVKSGYYTLASASSLNKIAPAAYSNQSKNFFTVGAEGYYRWNKMLFGIDGNIAVQNGESAYTEGIKFSSGLASARFGYIISEEKDYWVYPSIAAGMAIIDMNIYDKKNDATQNLLTYINRNPSIDVGLNTDFILKKHSGTEEGFSSILAGIRAGYKFSIKNRTWRDFYGNRIDGMPTYNQNGFYITATIGCGAFIKGKTSQKAE